MKVSKQMGKVAAVAALLMAIAMPMSAQRSYQHSLGVAVGSFDGVSYKRFLTDKWAVQADLGFRMLATQGSLRLDGYRMGTEAFNYWTFEANPNMVYQSLIDGWDWGGLSWFAGGGVSLGLAQGYAGTSTYGKWGLNGIVGLELGLDDAPLTIGLDFRPGYGMLFGNGFVANMFDWALAITVRYTF
ncbi:MAG: hypothetical protein NC038_02150 [Paludibacter sp.]|nr:hypothetical protein [Bacteroidales bacterium]MCM1068477.1 hypothetical protein [Prevotella sp.]MCM1353431.1 hypothetical protein [Bacteroides sp.]MCM1442592.1 hypothetical protein [Muribaculum sp.]MCM1481437.1 hypothetical protein [Paludibacter sp.]